MKITFTILLTFVTLLSFDQMSKDSLLRSNIDILVEELEFYYGYDQTLREYGIFKSFDKSETNRIENLPDSIKSKILFEREFKSDSLGKIIFRDYINPMDARHTARMIAITQKYGFPSVKRLRKYYTKEFKDEEFSPLILLIHSPKKYWEELKELIKVELEAKRINRCQYGYLLWHFNGRSDFKYMLENGYQWVVLENGRKTLKAVDCN
ncbi:MAG: hypothetical protein ACEPOZ_01660 [Marinifilaceae bacterium]